MGTKEERSVVAGKKERRRGGECYREERKEREKEEQKEEQKE